MNMSEKGKLGYEKSREKLLQLQQEKAQRLVDEYASAPKHCRHCGLLIPFEKRRNEFCSHACAGVYHRGTPDTPMRSEQCSCGNRKKRKNKYCAECIEKHVYNRASSLDRAGDARSRKRIIIEQRGHQCEVCNLSEWMTQPIPLEMDHVDGNADNNAANNLRLICPNCHAQTMTYKGASAGVGSSRQKMRRQRYADGKTY